MTGAAPGSGDERLVPVSPGLVRSWVGRPGLQLDTTSSFPALHWQKLRFAAGILVHLHLWGIPDAGYIIPLKLWPVAFAALTKLKSLRLLDSDPLDLILIARSDVLPALTHL